MVRFRHPNETTFTGNLESLSRQPKTQRFKLVHYLGQSLLHVTLLGKQKAHHACCTDGQIPCRILVPAWCLAHRVGGEVGSDTPYLPFVLAPLGWGVTSRLRRGRQLRRRTHIRNGRYSISPSPPLYTRPDYPVNWHLTIGIMFVIRSEIGNTLVNSYEQTVQPVGYSAHHAGQQRRRHTEAGHVGV